MTIFQFLFTTLICFNIYKNFDNLLKIILININFNIMESFNDLRRDINTITNLSNLELTDNSLFKNDKYEEVKNFLYIIILIFIISILLATGILNFYNMVSIVTMFLIVLATNIGKYIKTYKLSKISHDTIIDILTSYAYAQSYDDEKFDSTEIKKYIQSTASSRKSAYYNMLDLKNTCITLSIITAILTIIVFVVYFKILF